jgi:hypothetical protein
MSLAGTTIALLLPALLGTLAWHCVMGRPRDAGAWAASLGAGYVLGMLLVGVGMKAWPALSPQHAFGSFVPVVAAAILAMAGAWYRWRASAPVTLAFGAVAAAPATALARALAWALLALIAIEFVVVATQASTLPSLTWDAWNAWLAKSKAWYFADRFAPVLGFDAWLAAPAGEAITTTAPAYPGTLPRAMVWVASASGGWNEAAIHAMWPLLWLALGAGLFGYARLAGMSVLQSVATAAAVLALPLVTAHAALAGYADLWLAAAVVFAGVHLARAFGLRGSGAAWRRDAAMAAAWLLLLPCIKLEGAVWLLCALAAIAISLLPARWRWPALGVLVLAWALGLPFGGWPLPLPGVGTVRWGWGHIDVGVFGTMALAWRPVADEVAQSLFLLPNWNLLWYVAPFVLLARWRAIAGGGPGVVGWWLLAGYAFLFLLFFFTDASVWAENLTSLNRVLMQVVPLTVFWLSVLWVREPRLRTATPSAG